MEEPASAVGPVYCQNNNNFSHISGNAAKQVVQKSYVSIWNLAVATNFSLLHNIHTSSAAQPDNLLNRY